MARLKYITAAQDATLTDCMETVKMLELGQIRIEGDALVWPDGSKIEDIRVLKEMRAAQKEAKTAEQNFAKLQENTNTEIAKLVRERDSQAKEIKRLLAHKLSDNMAEVRELLDGHTNSITELLMRLSAEYKELSEGDMFYVHDVHEKIQNVLVKVRAKLNLSLIDDAGGGDEWLDDKKLTAGN